MVFPQRDIMTLPFCRKCYYFLLYLCVGVHSLPSQARARRSPISDQMISYLTSFGYLPQTDREVGLLRSEYQLRESIKTMQRFGNIPATGEMDKETLQLMSRPRCGMPDIPNFYKRRRRRFAIQGQKWGSTSLTWSLRTKRFTNSSLDYGRLRADFHRALRVWSRHSRLTFSEIDSKDADILISFEKGYHGDGYPFDGAGLVLAHAFFPGEGRGGDAHFDIEEAWTLSGDAKNEQGISLFLVAAHEFGHSLGLAHSSVQDSLMYPWYSYNDDGKELELSDDDRYGIQQLYGAKERGRVKSTVHRPLRPPYYGNPLVPVTETIRTTSTTSPTTTRPTTRSQWGVREEKPDTCNMSYDAVSYIRSELFIFHGRYTWRIGEGGLYPGYPALTSRLWNKLDNSFTRIDAVYERPISQKIVFFIGQQYYVFSGVDLDSGYPKPLAHLGLPHDLDHIDAAMVWGHNGKTYFFSGTMYWRFDEDVGRVELDYPRDIAVVWKGIGYNIDAAFQSKDGNVYFFKNKGFWKFNDRNMQVENKKQMQSSHFWMKCPAVDDGENEIPKNEPTSDDSEETGASTTSLPSNFALFVNIALIFIINRCVL